MNTEEDIPFVKSFEELALYINEYYEDNIVGKEMSQGTAALRMLAIKERSVSTRLQTEAIITAINALTTTIGLK